MYSHQDKLRARDGVSRVFCYSCNCLYRSKDESPIGFTIEYCCGQETEVDQNRIDFLIKLASQPQAISPRLEVVE